MIESASTQSGNDTPPTVLTAVFFVHLSATVGSMMKTWLDGGHRISAVVTYRQRRRAILSHPVEWLSLWPVMRLRHNIPVIAPKPPLDWVALRQTLAVGAPDVAITYGFMRLIPQSLTEMFPRGALNFHPALLPYYRGPQPFHRIAIDNAWASAGGVTLHEMTDAFDEGPIIAQAVMSDASIDTGLSIFLADALASMTQRVIPRYCAGDVRAWPQPPGDYPYASKGPMPELVVQPHWTRQYLNSLCSVITRRPGVTIEMSGKKIRILSEACVLGSPSGKPAVRRWSKIEFDLADRRVAYRRHTPINKLKGSFRTIRRLFRLPNLDIPIRLGPFETKSTPGQVDGEISAESSWKGSAA